MNSSIPRLRHPVDVLYHFLAACTLLLAVPNSTFFRVSAMATRLVSIGRISMGHTDRTTSITCVEVSNESVLRSKFFVTLFR